MTEAARNVPFNGENTLSLPARREAFAVLKNWLERIAAGLDLPPETKKHLLIAADEIFTNISNYGYPSGGGMVEIAAAFDPEQAVFSLAFSDSGIAYNPLEAPPPDLDKPLAEREPGGLGIFMVRQLMDTLDYRRENGRNILVLKKRVK